MDKHTPDKFGFQDEQARIFPKLILLAATSPCNARCPYCPSEVNKEIRRTPGLDGKQENWIRFEYYKKIAEECAKYGARIRISSYGETMLHPQFVELVEYSCALGVKTSIINNGSLMTPDKSERLVRCGTESIEISAESHIKETFEKLKVGLQYEAVMRNIRTLREVRDRLWNNPDANGLMNKPKTFIIVSIVNQQANPTIQESKEFFGRIADHVSVRSFLTWGLTQLQSQNPEQKHYLEGQTPCPYPFERCMVDPAGYIRLCPYDDQKLIPPFGHITTHSIAEVWQGQRWSDIRSCHGDTFDAGLARTKAPLCADCEDRRNRSWKFNYISITERMKMGQDNE